MFWPKGSIIAIDSQSALISLIMHFVWKAFGVMRVRVL